MTFFQVVQQGHMPTIEEDDECGSKRFPSFVFEFGGIMPRVAKQGDEQMSSQLLSLLTN